MSRRAPWLRLSLDYAEHPKVQKARAASVWPYVLCQIKRGRGVATEERLDPWVVSFALPPLTEEQARSCLDGLESVGLLVREGDGWTTPNWRQYQPDERSAGRERPSPAKPSQDEPGCPTLSQGQNGTPSRVDQRPVTTDKDKDQDKSAPRARETLALVPDEGSAEGREWTEALDTWAAAFGLDLGRRSKATLGKWKAAWRRARKDHDHQTLLDALGQAGQDQWFVATGHVGMDYLYGRRLEQLLTQLELPAPSSPQNVNDAWNCVKCHSREHQTRMMGDERVCVSCVPLPPRVGPEPEPMEF